MKEVKNTDRDNKLFKGSYQENLINPYFSEFPKFKPIITIAIMASGNGSNFESIVKSINEKRLNAYISVLIVNNPKCLVIKKAIKYGIPYLVINHKDFSSRLDFDKQIIRKLKEYSVELVVMAGWMRIVGEELISHFKNRLINIHPSLLPSFKGIDAIQQAIDNKVTITGCTVHHVQKEVDSGTIIIQAAIPRIYNENKDKLKERIQEMEHIILPLGIAIVAKQLRSKVKGKR